MVGVILIILPFDEYFFHEVRQVGVVSEEAADELLS